MKINYEKIKGKAILPLDSYNLHEIVLAFIYDGKLPITKDYLSSDLSLSDTPIYNIWCTFNDRMKRSQLEIGENFAIAIDPSAALGCVYGDIESLKNLGYEAISITDALDEYPNMANILRVTPNQTLEECGILPQSPFAPHRITLDGVIRANNGEWLAAEEVIDLLTNAGFISNGDNALNAGYIDSEHKEAETNDAQDESNGIDADKVKRRYNGLYDLFGLSSDDFFTLKGYSYEGFSSDDDLKGLMEACEENTGLIYDLINHPEKIQKAAVSDIVSIRKVPERLQKH
ncbi:MAG: hypothetical protein K2L98_03690 [Bacilli bacterium]|nr:hypothetical protein [Bacilli bacterium]